MWKTQLHRCQITWSAGVIVCIYEICYECSSSVSVQHASRHVSTKPRQVCVLLTSARVMPHNCEVIQTELSMNDKSSVNGLGRGILQTFCSVSIPIMGFISHKYLWSSVQNMVAEVLAFAQILLGILTYFNTQRFHYMQRSILLKSSSGKKGRGDKLLSSSERFHNVATWIPSIQLVSFLLVGTGQNGSNGGSRGGLNSKAMVMMLLAAMLSLKFLQMKTWAMYLMDSSVSSASWGGGVLHSYPVAIWFVVSDVPYPLSGIWHQNVQFAGRQSGVLSGYMILEVDIIVHFVV